MLQKSVHGSFSYTNMLDTNVVFLIGVKENELFNISSSWDSQLFIDRLNNQLCMSQKELWFINYDNQQ